MIDLSGQKFGRLVAVKPYGKDESGSYKWLCNCDCGKAKIIRGTSLRNGNSRSCGCWQKEIVSKVNKKHGCYKTRTYKSWLQIIQRCTNPKNMAYDNYGGRGIKISRRWRKFVNFLEDMGNVPAGYQIDRINNNRGYNKNNCRWVTPKQNSRNQRSNLLEKHGGTSQCISAWAEEYNIPYQILWSRLYVYHWSMDKALTMPIKRSSRQ